MPTHTDRYGRRIGQTTSEEGQAFDIPGVGGMILPHSTSWAEARERIEAMAPPGASEDPVPASIPAWKGKVVLHQQGLLTAAQAAIAAAGPVAQIAWAEAGEWSRSGTLLEAMAAALKLTEAQVDDLFRTAAGVTV
jgi:hypothetical protein